MPFDFQRIKRQKAEPRRFELTDPAAPGEVQVVWLKAIQDEVESAGIAARVNDLAQRYIHGGFTLPNGNWSKDPIPFPPIDDQEVKITIGFIRLAAQLEKMQTGKGDEFLGFDKLVYCATLAKDAFGQLQEHAATVQRDFDGSAGEKGKDSGTPDNLDAHPQT